MGFDKRTIDGITYEDDVLIEVDNNAKLADVINVKEGTKKISSRTFQDAMINHVKFPESLEVIENAAFKDCICLKEVIIKNPCILGIYAFYNTQDLSTLVLNCETIPSIGFYYAGVYSLTNGVDIKLIDTAVIGENAFERARINSLEIQSNRFRCIDSRAFLNASFRFETLKLPEGLEEIGDYVFEACSGLKDVYIPDSIKHIGELDKKVIYHVSEKIMNRFLFLRGMTNVVVEKEPTMDDILDTMTFKDYNKQQLELDKDDKTL